MEERGILTDARYVIFCREYNTPIGVRKYSDDDLHEIIVEASIQRELFYEVTIFDSLDERVVYKNTNRDHICVFKDPVRRKLKKVNWQKEGF